MNRRHGIGRRVGRRGGRAVALFAGTFLSVLVGVGSASTAQAATSQTCAGGSLAPGIHGSVTVTGFCSVPAGLVDIRGSLTIAPGGALDASSDCGARLRVLSGVFVQHDGVLFLGSSPDSGCPSSSNDIVGGGLRASGALAVVIHGVTIDGGMTVQGGGGGTTCDNVPGLPFPPFSNLEDSTVNGGVTFAGMSTCWMGIIRNRVHGGVTVVNNRMGDPDAIEVGLNDIRGGLACAGNRLAFPGPGGFPTNSFDGSPPQPNHVTGRETGQCGGL